MPENRSEKETMQAGPDSSPKKPWGPALPRGLEVVMISAPFDYPPRPSIALSMFQTSLREAGISSKILYPMFLMDELMGSRGIELSVNIKAITFFQEFIFSHLTGNTVTLEKLNLLPDRKERENTNAAVREGLQEENELQEAREGRDAVSRAFVEYIMTLDPQLTQEEVQELITLGRRSATLLVEEVAREVAECSPKVVACSSLFAQQNASLALLRRIKELLPQVKTLMGGPNCSGEAGRVLLGEHYPYVDAVFFGEGDEVFPQTIRGLIEGGELPYGAVRRGEVPSSLPYRLTRDLDTCPIPDYHDYLEYLPFVSEGMKKRMSYSLFGNIKCLLIMIEGSRGCQWGEKHPCRFCALNGEHNHYRIKSADRVFKELMYQAKTYQSHLFEFTDNMLSFQHIRELLPRMRQEASGRFYAIAEIKPFLKREQIFQLKRAGFRWIQIGLENLNDHLITLMNKGTRAVDHISFLKGCLLCGIFPLWSMLYRIPGEQPEDYEELIRLLPLLFHLNAPGGFGPIRFQRGSCYANDPKGYGLELAPCRFYSYSFGDEDICRAFAIDYEDVGGEESAHLNAMKPYHDRMKDVLIEWQKSRKGDFPGCYFIMEKRGNLLLLADTRPCAKVPLAYLSGASGEICLFCDQPRSWEEIRKAFASRYEEEELKASLQLLLDKQAMVFLSQKYLTLATEGKLSKAPTGQGNI